MRPLPSIRALEGFAAVAQTGSLSAAADLVGMSLPALSRRLQQLEQELGLPLLRRLPRGTVLTEHGERYFASIRPALDAIRLATTDLRSSAARPTVRVSTTSSLARNVLIPRLSRFEAAHPNIRISLDLSPRQVTPDLGEHDVAIRLGERGRSTAAHKELFPLTLFPVCTPELATRLREVRDLRETQLIGPHHGPAFWHEWWDGVGLPVDDLPPVRVIDGDLLYEAAASGMGVAIGLCPLVRPMLEDGRLARPLDADVRSSCSVNLTCRAFPEPARTVRTFCEWLMAQGALTSGPAPEGGPLQLGRLRTEPCAADCRAEPRHASNDTARSLPDRGTRSLVETTR